MEINNITITGNTLTITVDSTVGITKVYIDSLYNDINKYSNVDGNHTHVITSFTTTSTTIVINITQINPTLDTSAFTILINNVLGFYYDDQELYNKQVHLLVNHCSSCLNDEIMNTIQILTLQLGLLTYAKNNHLIEDEIRIYKDIARLLCININSNSNINHCTNGYCNIC